MRTSSMMVAALVAGISGMGMGSVFNASDAATPGISPTSQRAINKTAQSPSKQAARNEMRAMLGGGIGTGYGLRRRAAYGWTNRHVQRVALKARNQVKHRARGKSRRAS